MLFGPQGAPEALRMFKGPCSTLAPLPEPGEAWLSCASWAGLSPPSLTGSSPCPPTGRPGLPAWRPALLSGCSRQAPC